MFCKKSVYFFVLLFFLANTKVECVDNTPPSVILQLYQMAKDIHEIFVENDLEYFIFAGTLLGSVRHKGIIPWDDDLDMMVYLKDEKLLFSLKNEFERRGYGLLKEKTGLVRIFPKDGEPFPGRSFKFPFTDIFLATVMNGTIYYYKEKKTVRFYLDELYPLKEYSFGETVLYGPRKTDRYLARWFGKDWENKAVKYNHASREREVALLTEEDRRPAQPTGPLENRG